MHIKIHIPSQTLSLYSGDKLIDRYSISTAAHGAGERLNSGKTPRGAHVIRAKIGAGMPINTVFVGRRPTGEIYSRALAEKAPKRDWILTRILWLSGLEVGKNRLGECDTMRRYIYIHGCPDECPMGTPQSHGCIRMRHDDVIALFDRVERGTRVDILAEDERRT